MFGCLTIYFNISRWDVYTTAICVSFASFSGLSIFYCPCSILKHLLTFQGGMFILQLFDNYAATYSLLFIGLVECIGIAWVYGKFIYSVFVVKF
jgi:hypothetical protein